MLTSIGDWMTSHGWFALSEIADSAVILVVALGVRAVVGRLITHLMARLSHARATTHTWRNRLRKDHTPLNQRQAARAATLSSILRSTASVLIFGVALVMMLDEFHVNIGPILASAGVVGLAIGFGAQSLVKDVLAGMFMMAEDQYGVGDVINVGTAVGTVEGVTLRIVKIRDLDGALWYVRNGEITSVCNMSQDWANAVVEVPLEPTANLAKANNVIEQALERFADGRQDLLSKPDIAGVTSLNNGAVTVRVLVKTKPNAQWAVGRAMRIALKEALDDEGIHIAMPPAFTTPNSNAIH